MTDHRKFILIIPKSMRS